jgi:hypothetical protein
MHIIIINSIKIFLQQFSVKINPYLIELFGKVTEKFYVTEHLITYFEFLNYVRETEIR